MYWLTKKIGRKVENTIWIVSTKISTFQKPEATNQKNVFYLPEGARYMDYLHEDLQLSEAGGHQTSPQKATRSTL